VSIRRILFAALLAGAAMAMSTASLAQFDGLYIGGGFTRFKASETLPDFPFVGDSTTIGVQDHQGGFNGNAGFGFSLSMLYLAVEASYSSQIGKITVTRGGTDFSDGVEQAGAVSILPGLKLGTGALIYARIGTAQATLKSQSGDFSQTHKGTLFGIGMKGAVAKNLALVVEYQNYDLKEKEGVKPDAVGVVLGAQYTFW
jgi:opacity protein-like surface antigen